MTEPMPAPERHDNRERKARRGRKLRDLALLLPCAGAVVFATPVLDIFAAANSGIGHKVVFVFGGWIALIVAAFFLSRALRAEIREK